MRTKIYKKTSKYEDIYTKEKKTKEVEITLDNGCIVRITEHQLGKTLNIPHIDITCKKGCYEMDFNTFLNKFDS